MPDLAGRFWVKVERRGPGDCWPWLAGIGSDGYGAFQMGRGVGMRRSHIVAYELAVGPTPLGMVLDHTCHNESGCPGGEGCPHRRCCNPAHLEPVTRGTNVMRGSMPNMIAHRDDMCGSGRHPLTGGNVYVRPHGRRECRACRRERRRNGGGQGVAVFGNDQGL